MAAALTAVGIVWGIADVKDLPGPQARRGLPDPVTIVAASKQQEANPTPEPAAVPLVAQPPATATAAAEQTVSEQMAPAADETTDKKQATRRVATSAAKPLSRATAPTVAKAEDAQEPAPATSPGESSTNVNAPVSPTTGIVDPKAFPSSAGAATAARVRVEVDQPDSRITVRGKVATAPYVFDVPKGTRVVLEVARAGYITRRIVLDGSREFVRIGMIPVPKAQAPADEPAPTPDNPAEP